MAIAVRMYFTSWNQYIFLSHECADRDNDRNDNQHLMMIRMKIFILPPMLQKMETSKEILLHH
jgi:hypothetical protein